MFKHDQRRSKQLQKQQQSREIPQQQRQRHSHNFKCIDSINKSHYENGCNGFIVLPSGRVLNDCICDQSGDKNKQQQQQQP